MDKQNKYTNSSRAFIEACECLPGGVNSPVRAFGGVDESPVFIESASGSKIRDIDGNEYIDYVGSWGPMIVGHAHPAVLKAVTAAAKRGTSFGAPTQAETTLAKKIIDAFDSIDKVRLVSSGTEAVMSAIRLARGYTKKDLIIKMVGCYHGHSDCLLAAAGSGLAEGSIASSPGVPDSIAKLTIIIDYNDVEAITKAFEVYKGKIAAVLVEPVAANMGVVPPGEGYLQALRDLCEREGSLLIFDEVITGFRVALGGAQQLYNIKADMTCLGKIIGGGLPVGAFGGRAEIMDMLAPVGPVYQAGTLSGNPLATAAAIATIDILAQAGTYEQLESSAAMLEAGLEDAAKQAGIETALNRVGSIMSCFFTPPGDASRRDKKVRNFADVQSTDIKRFKKFFSSMLALGIYLAPSAYEAMFVSLAHSGSDIEKTIEAARISFQKLRS